MTYVEEIKQQLAAAEAELENVKAERKRIADACEAATVEINKALEPLRAECLRRLEQHDHSEMTNRLRAQRDILVAQVGEAQRPLHEFECNGYGLRVRGLMDHINALRPRLKDALAQAEFDALSDDDLTKAECQARSALDWKRKTLADDVEALALTRTRISEAHEVVEIAVADMAQISELRGQREAMQGQGFISGKPDAKALAEVDKQMAALEKSLERDRAKADGARAAIPQLEGTITGWEEAILTSQAQVEAAEADLLQATYRRAVRQIEGLVDALYEPLLSIGAAAPEVATTLCQALRDGLDHIRYDGQIVRPGWLAADSFTHEAAALRAEILGHTSEARATFSGVAVGMKAGVFTAEGKKSPEVEEETL